MLNIEILGNAEAIEAACDDIGPLAQDQPRKFVHRGIVGEAAVWGVVTTILPHALPLLIDLLKPLVSHDRDLKVSVNGHDFQVRDVAEFSAVLDTLKAHGIFPNA